MKKLLLLLCAFMASISGAWGQEPVNLAEDCSVYLITTPTGFTNDNLIGITDGVENVAVPIAYYNPDPAAFEVASWYIDLENLTELGSIKIKWEGALASDYKIFGGTSTEGIDNDNWGTELGSKTGEARTPGDKVHTFEFAAASYRYIKFLPSNTENWTDKGWNVKLYELYAYAPIAKILSGISLPYHIFSATAGYNFNATPIDQFGDAYTGTVTFGWQDNVSPVGAVINNNNITFGAASGSGTYTLKAESGTTTVTTPVYMIETNPDAPTEDAGNVLAIYCGTYGTETYDGWATNWEWGYGSRDIVSINGDNSVRIHNVGTYGFPYPDTDLTQYAKLNFDIYTVESVSGYVKIEKTNINNKAFTTTAGAWKHVEIDLTGITMAAEGNRWIDFYIGENNTDKDRDILIDNIYFSKTAETITSISLEAASTEVPVSRTLQLTVKDQSDNVVAASLVDFEVNNANVSVDETGMVTGVAEGSATITATLKADNTIYNTYDLTVTPKPLGQEFVNGTHSIFVQAFHDVGTNNYELIITSEEQMEGMGGSFWNVNGEGADMRNTLVISGDKKTMTIVVESTSAPNIYTPLYILMPGEISFNPVTLEWIERVKDGLYVDVESTTATVIGTIATADITNLKTAAGDASIVDVSRATISSTVALEATNPNAVVIATDAQKTSLTGTKNLVIKDGSTYTADEITYTDQAGTVPANLAITTGEVSYTRTDMAVGKLFSVVLPFSADIPTNFKAYQVSAFSGSKMTFEEISGKTLSAGIAYVIKSETTSAFVASKTSTTLDFTERPYTTAGVTTTANLTQILDNTGDKYVLSDNKIKKLVGTAKVAAFRGYFTIPAGSNVIDIDLEGDVTGIENLKNDNLDNAVFYDLNGHQVANPTKGLYIVNGKKVILK